MKTILRIAALVVFVGTLTTACSAQIDRVTADKLAQAALERYSKDEALTLTKFSTADVVEENGNWSYRYTYNERPRQLVAIIVHKDGRTEVTRMFEELKLKMIPTKKIDSLNQAEFNWELKTLTNVTENESDSK
jgi:hypothetical protein